MTATMSDDSNHERQQQPRVTTITTSDDSNHERQQQSRVTTITTSNDSNHERQQRCQQSCAMKETMRDASKQCAVPATKDDASNNNQSNKLHKLLITRQDSIKIDNGL